MLVPSLPAGTYFVIVDGVANTAGEFDLTVTKGAPIPAPTNDSCGAAEQLYFNGNVATVQGHTFLGTDDFTSSCQTTSLLFNGSDVVYRFELTDTSAVSAKVTRDPSTTAFDPAVTIQAACPTTAGEPTNELACGRQTSGVALAAATDLAPGVYYVVVDGVSTSSTTAGQPGRFTLEVTVTPPPPNDTCGTAGANAEPLMFVDEAAVAYGDTSLARTDTNGACSTATTGRDLVYSFTLPAEKTVTVTAAPTAGSTLKPVVYLRSTCDDTATQPQVACDYTSTAGTAASFVMPRLAAGTYFVWVDSYSTTMGAFSLTVSVADPPAAPENDTCAGTVPSIDLSSGSASMVVDTTFANDNYTGTCATTTYTFDGPDLVYSFQLQQARSLSVTMQRSDSNDGLKPAWYVRRTCDSALAAEQLGCKYTTGSTATTTVVPWLDAGTYYIVLDGVDGTYGDFALTLQTGEPIPDTCANAQPLAFTNDVATARGDTTNATSESHSYGTCGGSSDAGKDVVYRVSVAAESQLAIDVVPDAAAGSTLRPSVYLRSVCDDKTTEVPTACLENTALGPVNLVVPRVPAGDYYLFVDATGSSYKGAFDLTVTRTDVTPASNDLCAAPQIVQLDPTGVATTITADTGLGMNDSAGTCSTSTYPLNGRDLVYQINLSADSAFRATVTRDATLSPGFLPALYLRKTACDSTAAEDELGCLPKTSNTTGTVTIARSFLSAGTYYLFVDGQKSTSGVFNLELVAQPPVPGDSCDQPLGLTFVPDAVDPKEVATVSGDTSSFADDSKGSCGGSSTTYVPPDLVYSFTTTSVKSLNVKLASKGVLKPTVYLRTKCGDAASEVVNGCAYKSTTTAPVEAVLDLPLLEPNTYYLWVDGYAASAGSAGAFNLTVTLSEPPAAPVNDSCAGAIPLNLDSNGHAQVSGDLTYAFNDATGSCANGNGGDTVYQLAVQAETKLTVTVTESDVASKLKPMVYLRSDCSGDAHANELSCAKGTAGTTTVKSVATTFVNTIGPGIYYLWVDGYDGTYGAYTMDVQLSAPVAGPLNESCYSAEPLPFFGDVATLTGTTLNAANDAGGSCASNSVSYNGDVVYSFTTTDFRKISAQVVPTTSTYRPVVYVRSACGQYGSTAEVLCDSTSTDGDTATDTVNNAPAGTYFVWVDGNGSSTGTAQQTGDFTLTVTLGHPPSNDNCQQSPTVMAPATNYVGNTSEAMDDYGSETLSDVCVVGTTTTLPGEDLVFSYTPAVDGEFTVTVTPAAGATAFNPYVWLTEGGCGSDGATCVAAANAAAAGAAETLVYQGVAGTTYYVYVDSTSSSTTANREFTISVQ